MLDKTLEKILPGQDILNLLPSTGIPEEDWGYFDDRCECTFQIVRWWTNPYIARTLEIRFCCIMAELGAQFPQHIREIPAYDNPNAPKGVHDYQVKPREWNGDFDMPRALWHRQLAVQHGLPLSTIRMMYENEEPPKAVIKDGD